MGLADTARTAGRSMSGVRNLAVKSGIAALILASPTIAFLLAIGATFVLGVRVGRHARYIRCATEPIRPWMSVPFIAHTHHVPVQTLFQAIGTQPQQPHDRRPLRRIAREEKRPVADLIRELNDAIAKSRGPSSNEPRSPESRSPEPDRKGP